MLNAGLTGGIASGKSTVAEIMRELGCHVLDADRLAHHLIEPGQAGYAGIVQEFGPEILDAQDRIVRSRLAEIVFANPARLQRLNELVHPHVLAGLDVELQKLSQSDPRGVAIVEAPLLIEAGYHRKLDHLIVVWCRPEQQVERLTSTRGMAAEEARQRIASQMPLEEKLQLADDTIDCSGTLEHTREQVLALVDRLKQEAARQPAKR